MEIIIITSLTTIIGFVFFGLSWKKNQQLLKQQELLNTLLQEKNLLINTFETKYENEIQQNLHFQEKINILENNKNNLSNELTTKKALLAKLETELELIKAHQIKSETILQNQFKNLATEILEGNSKKLTSQNKETLALILTPMQEQIKEFKKKVEDVYDKEAKERNILQAELKMLKELNLKMSNDAINLTNALKGQKKQQGIWGEMVLENVLENSGLREGHEYIREMNLKDENNTNFRPDVIVNLPDNRHIIIDAKTSLNSYNEYYSCESEDEKALHLKRHILALKEHIKSLANKKYEKLEGINSLDFIFMFVPIEAALLIALENDINMYDDAFKQKIILVSPTTLLVALRAVENTWRYEKQAQSISDVAKRAELLYAKFNGFVEDMTKVSDYLDKANNSHQKAFEKLSIGTGNLISQVTMLQKVSNINPKKQIDTKLVENALESDI